MATRRATAGKFDIHKSSSEAKSPNVNSKRRYNILPTLWHTFMVALYVVFMYLGGKASVALAPHLKGKVPAIGGQFKYLTLINFWLQMLFFILQLISDITCSKTLQRACSYLFTTLVFPTAVMITLVFWFIYNIDNNLIYPDLFVRLVPSYVNHFWHSAILLWVLLEVYFVRHHFPSNTTAVITLLSFCLSYNTWLLYIHYKTGHWVYPFLGKLSYLQVQGFFIFCMLISTSMYFLAKKLTSVFWGQRRD